jgi:ribosome-binding factor A
METTRQNKIARLLQKELSDIFLLQTKSMPGILISVSAVRISPDMSVARAYLSVFPSERSEEIIKNVNANMKSIRFELGTRVRHPAHRDAGYNINGIMLLLREEITAGYKKRKIHGWGLTTISVVHRFFPDNPASRPRRTSVRE